MKKDIKPSLFGQKHTSRDYTKASAWGKNMFNSSFPASLIAYMYSKDISPVYIKIDEENRLRHDYLSGAQLYGIDPLSDDTYYHFGRWSRLVES